MGRKGVTYKDVAKAADQIAATGDNPTIKKIMVTLGTGSPNTIHRHLRTWREKTPAIGSNPPELPHELQAAIIKEIERQANRARADLENELTQARQEAVELAQTGEQLEKEMTELKQQDRELSDESQRLKALASEREKEIQALKAQLSEQRQVTEKLKIRIAVCDSRLDSAMQTIDGLKADLEQKRMESTQYQTEAAELRGELSAMKKVKRPK